MACSNPFSFAAPHVLKFSQWRSHRSEDRSIFLSRVHASTTLRGDFDAHSTKRPTVEFFLLIFHAMIHDRESSADRRTKENIVLIIVGSRSIVSSFLLQWRSIYPFGRRSNERTLNRRFSWTSRHSTVAELRFTTNYIITIMTMARVNSVFKRCRERSRILQLTESQLWDILFDSRWITSWPATTGQCFGPIDRSTSRRVRVAFDDEERKRRSE